MLKLDFHADFTEHHPAFCALPFNKLILNSWGEVSMCCHQLTQLGKLDATTEVLDLWNSSLAKEIRQHTTENLLHPVCASWNSCPYLVKERVSGPVRMWRRAAYPSYLEISLPDTHCNIGGENPSDSNPACIMCRRNFHVSHTPDLTDFLCDKAKSLMPYLMYLCVLGIAEPFWRDAVFRIFERLEFHRYKSHLCFTTNTNGTCLNARTAQRFFAEVEWSEISWSLDSATPDTHVKIRRLDAFDLVVKNLRNWIRLRDEHGGAEHHKVSIYNNINLLNVHEMTAMVELAVDIGVDSMTMLPTYDQAGVVDLGELVLGPKNVGIFKEAAKRAMERARELNFSLQYSKRFDVVPPPPPTPVEII